MKFSDFEFISQIYNMVEVGSYTKRDFDETKQSYFDVESKIIEPIRKENQEKADEFERLTSVAEVYSEWQGYVYGFVSALRLMSEVWKL